MVESTDGLPSTGVFLVLIGIVGGINLLLLVMWGAPPGYWVLLAGLLVLTPFVLIGSALLRAYSELA